MSIRVLLSGCVSTACPHAPVLHTERCDSSMYKPFFAHSTFWMQMELQGAWGTAVLCGLRAPGYLRFLPGSGTLQHAPAEAGPQACAPMILILALSALHMISSTHLPACAGVEANWVYANSSCGGARCQCCSCGLQRGSGHHHLSHPVLQPLSPDP